MSDMGDYSREESIFGFSGPMARLVAAAILLIAITVVLSSLPEKTSEWIRSREMIRKLFLFPILLSAMWFGARGAAASTVFATIVCGGLAGNAWPVEVSSQVERVGEVAVFWLVGGLSASFFEQQKRFVGQIEVANDNTLLALAAALDVREHNTGVHSQRVADYTLRLAREAGIRDKDTLDVFWRGALLHDVGKIGIPDEVLLKPGPLSQEEWVVMRNHPEMGARMLRKIEFLHGPSEIVLSHHERYDGAGYPRKMKGAQIPLGARLFAVIDVYDALTTDRAYHTARSHTDALTKIREESDTHFDPAVVAAFAKIPFEELREIAKKNQTPLIFASPPVPSLHQVASVLSPGS
ncbi:HD-GYP domain-containing protein [Candidatus Deferrimicrobium sp.]|uniref:HD-GYP domain-containing protein n=1 Tax=Candidatus Deferrimicrobium sp. TaxID=3060586 RepID=UPI0027286AD7|nr:HD-GYP domain-containing protein [Candidatus Deferrimicrobium sp.]MDO8739353.1 HD-GYP domain-containing protein [Candidatus Deferrimicrobium sp.]